MRGVISGITFVTLYDWYVSLTELQFAPDSDAGTLMKTDLRPPEKFDPEDADKAFAWLRREACLAVQPFGDVADQKKRRKDFSSKLGSLAGTKVRWIWPATIVNGNAIAVQDTLVDEYPYQVNFAIGLLLKQPKATNKSGQSCATSALEYAKVFFGSPGSKGISPEVLAEDSRGQKSYRKGENRQDSLCRRRSGTPAYDADSGAARRCFGRALTASQ